MCGVVAGITTHIIQICSTTQSFNELGSVKGIHFFFFFEKYSYAFAKHKTEIPNIFIDSAYIQFSL